MSKYCKKGPLSFKSSKTFRENFFVKSLQNIKDRKEGVLDISFRHGLEAFYSSKPSKTCLPK